MERGRFSRPPLGAPWQSGGAPMAAIIKGGRLGGDGGASVWVAKAGTAGRDVGSERG